MRFTFESSNSTKLQNIKSNNTNQIPQDSYFKSKTKSRVSLLNKYSCGSISKPK